MKTKYYVIYAIGIIISFVFILLTILDLASGYSLNFRNSSYLLTGTVFFCFFTAWFVIKREDSRYYTQEIKKYYNNLYNCVFNKSDEADSNSKQMMEPLKFMLANMSEMREYYLLSRKMTKISFVVSVIFCFLGIILYSFAIVTFFARTYSNIIGFALFKDMAAMNSFFSVVSGSIVEIIAGTSFLIHKKELEQLNHYYEAFYADEKILSAISLVDRVTESKRDEVYVNIINKQLESIKKEKEIGDT